ARAADRPTAGTAPRGARGRGTRARRARRRARAASAEPVHAREARREQADEQRSRQPDDVEEISLDPLDEARAESLDRIAAGAAFPLARGDVVREIARRQLAKRHVGALLVQLLPRVGPEAEAGDDVVRAPREPFEHLLGLRLVTRLPEQLALEDHLRVDAEDRTLASVDRSRLAGRALGRRGPLDLLEDRSDDVERDAQLRQDRAPLRRRRREDQRLRRRATQMTSHGHCFAHSAVTYV